MIVRGVNLEIKTGETHALMGPNGSGKSTLANAIMGHPKYKIEKGKILLGGKNITELSANKKAKVGLFLSMQNQPTLHGISISGFLRTAYNAIKGTKLGVVDFNRLLRSKMDALEIEPDFGKRNLHEGFSGGEKKRAEVLQLTVLEPLFALLDETDSGLDVDALKIVATGINKMRNNKRGFLIITHYLKMLKFITPDKVHIMKDGIIIKSGGPKLAHRIEKYGYDKI